MASVDAASLREAYEDAKARLAVLRRDGKVSPEVEAVIGVLFALLGILVAVFLEKTTAKTSRNSSLPPSPTPPDETTQRGGHGRGAKPNRQTSASRRQVTVEETIAVEACEACGADLQEVEPVDRERRVEAEIKKCPDCRARTKGRFPDIMPGPRQYGIGLQAFIINLLIAHMLSLRRATALVQAISGLTLSEATCLGYVRRLHDALQAWEETAVAQLLERPALHADETGFRVDGRTQWLHVVSDGSLTCKRRHRKRGREAIEDIGIIPRYTGVLIHDGWAAYLAYGQCRHQLCGSHLLRELTFIVDANGFRWARLMKALLREACHKVNQSTTGTLTEAERRAVRKRYRTLLTQGGKELPDLPPRPKGTTRTDREVRCPQPPGTARQTRSVGAALHGRTGRALHPQHRRAEDPDGQGQDQGVRMLPHPVLRPSLVPDLQLPQLHGRPRLQPPRRHPDRTRRRRRRQDQAAPHPARTQRGVSSYSQGTAQRARIPHDDLALQRAGAGA